MCFTQYVHCHNCSNCSLRIIVQDMRHLVKVIERCSGMTVSAAMANISRMLKLFSALEILYFIEYIAIYSLGFCALADIIFTVFVRSSFSATRYLKIEFS